MKRISNIMVHFLIRMLIGAALIIFVNEFLTANNISISVGVNPITLLTSGTLGVPGICLLYGIVLYPGI